MKGAAYRAAPAHGSAWVTGASSGLGRGVALELARRGYTVFATARRADLLEELAAESAGLPGRIVAAPGDVTDRAGVAALYAGIEAQGPVALAVLNAGGALARQARRLRRRGVPAHLRRQCARPRQFGQSGSQRHAGARDGADRQSSAR